LIMRTGSWVPSTWHKLLSRGRDPNPVNTIMISAGQARPGQAGQMAAQPDRWLSFDGPDMPPADMSQPSLQ
jgi:hypothetical protein